MSGHKFALATLHALMTPDPRVRRATLRLMNARRAAASARARADEAVALVAYREAELRIAQIKAADHA